MSRVQEDGKTIIRFYLSQWMSQHEPQEAYTDTTRTERGNSNKQLISLAVAVRRIESIIGVSSIRQTICLQRNSSGILSSSSSSSSVSKPLGSLSYRSGGNLSKDQLINLLPDFGGLPILLLNSFIQADRYIIHYGVYTYISQSPLHIALSLSNLSDLYIYHIHLLDYILQHQHPPQSSTH